MPLHMKRELNMKYPIAVELGDQYTAFGVVVPDITGCFSAGDSLDEAIENAYEAIEAHLELLAENNTNIPSASRIEDLRSDPDYAGYIWSFVDIDITPYLGKSHKINVTLPDLLIKRIDDVVAASGKYKSRSGFLAIAAQLILKSSETKQHC